MKLRNWYGIHLTSDECPPASTLTIGIRPKINEFCDQVETDQEQWMRGRIHQASGAFPAILVRRETMRDEDFLRRREEAETWLAGMDQEPNRDLAIAQIRRTRQCIWLMPFTIRNISGGRMARACEQISGYLARWGDGLIQVEGGFFNVEGESLIPYNPRHRMKTR